MNALRELRRTADLSQRECAALIDVPGNTFRMWDSGLRPVPPHMLQRTRLAVTEHARNTEPLSLDQLARELGVHQRTLRAAARTGRLQATFSSRSAFGRPIRLATRAAGQAFMRRDYRRYGGQSPAVAPLPSVPDDYDMRLKRLRRRLRLTQHDLARRIGATGKSGHLSVGVAEENTLAGAVAAGPAVATRQSAHGGSECGYPEGITRNGEHAVRGRRR
jgi:DNA-binding XRE family transcriptional regulator